MADDTNLQKIKSFNKASGAQIPTPQNPAQTVVTPTSKMSVNDIQLLLADPNTLSKEDLLRRQALSTKENLRQAEAEKKKQDDIVREQALKARDAQQLIKGEAINLGANLADRTAPAGNWIASRPTPGGIAGLLIIIAVFLLAIVPTQPTGKSRLNLIWLTLTGKTHIDYSQTGQATAQNSTPAVIPASPPPPLSTQQPQGQPVTQTLASPDQNMGAVITGMWNL